MTGRGSGSVIGQGFDPAISYNITVSSAVSGGVGHVMVSRDGAFLETLSAHSANTMYSEKHASKAGGGGGGGADVPKLVKICEDVRTL